MNDITIESPETEDSVFSEFPVPAGAKTLVLNRTSGDMIFKIDGSVAPIVIATEDYQFVGADGKYVKVSFKKTPGPFKNVPVK